MSKAKIIAGNWKMNLGFEESMDLFKGIRNFIGNNPSNSTCIIFPQVVISGIIAQQNNKEASQLKVGIQNVSEFESGAYTGDSSASLSKQVGFDYALIGHSERRHVFGEKNISMENRIKHAINEKLGLIYCVGETLDEREAGKIDSVLKTQLDPLSDHLSSNRVYIAYEPVWAIGTGKTATTNEAEQAHKIIRNYIGENESQALSTPILYGGSVSVSNALELLQTDGVDGLLIGGASLKLEDFCKIISLAN